MHAQHVWAVGTVLLSLHLSPVLTFPGGQAWSFSLAIPVPECGYDQIISRPALPESSWRMRCVFQMGTDLLIRAPHHRGSLSSADTWRHWVHVCKSVGMWRHSAIATSLDRKLHVRGTLHNGGIRNPRAPTWSLLSTHTGGGYCPINISYINTGEKVPSIATINPSIHCNADSANRCTQVCSVLMLLSTIHMACSSI